MHFCKGPYIRDPSMQMAASPRAASSCHRSSSAWTQEKTHHVHTYIGKKVRQSYCLAIRTSIAQIWNNRDKLGILFLEARPSNKHTTFSSRHRAEPCHPAYSLPRFPLEPCYNCCMLVLSAPSKNKQSMTSSANSFLSLRKRTQASNARR